MPSQKLIYDVTVSVSSSRSLAAASKTLQSVQSKQACKSHSVLLVHLFTVLSTGLADFSLCLYVSIRLTQQWSESPKAAHETVICILYCGVTMVKYITVPGHLFDCILAVHGRDLLFF